MRGTRRAYHAARSAYLGYVKPIATSIRARKGAVDSGEFWRSWWEENPVDDVHAVERGDSPVMPAIIHYRGMETTLLAAMYRNGIDPRGATVLDVGTGAGHFLPFWKGLGAGDVVGVDTSETAVVEAARRAPGADVYQADLTDGGSLPVEADSVDIVSGIGVMFHLVDDDAFKSALSQLWRVTSPDGHILLSGEIGRLTRSRQFTREGEVFKKVRSRRAWRRACVESRLRPVDVVEGPTYVGIDIPENNVLVARSC